MSSVRREVLRFAIPGFVVLLLVAAAASWLALTLSTEEAVQDARDDARLLARGVVEPGVTDDLVKGDPDALQYLDAVVRDRVLSGSVVSVRLWTEDGTIVYADEPDLIGRRFDLDDESLEVIREGGAEAELSDLDSPENASQRQYGELLEVYLRVRTPEGRPLLFEVYERQSSIDSRAREIFLDLLPLVLVPLVVLLGVELTLAWRMARRLQQSTADREALLRHALDSSEAERRRIAAHLHDGVVQDLAGVTYALAALSDTARSGGDDEQADRLTAAAADTRRSVRSLRSLLVEIYPPNLADAGLAAALSDLAASCSRDGTTVDVDVDPELALSSDDEAIVYRVAREALANVVKHAGASRAGISVNAVGTGARLVVVDDGRGFDPDHSPEGHVGLRLLHDLARERGADLDVQSAPGEGTRICLEVPG